MTSDNNTQHPTPSQQAWMDLKFGMFVHLGVNTYHDTEWSDGTLDHTQYNPTKLDTDQWCRVAKDAGMKYIVPTTKHHDGFCLWPTKYTDYSVATTPVKTDVIAELANSAHKYGLKLGLYYSLWDRHEKSHDEDEPRYVDFMKGQLEELLTNYGDIAELWFDGFWSKQQSGWEEEITDETGEKVFGGEASEERDNAFIQSWRNEAAYRWQFDHLYQFIKSLQPNCMVMNNSTTAYTGVPLHPVDVRSGEKFTAYNPDVKSVWNWLGKDIYLPMQIENTMSTKGNKQFPSGNWFWHDWDNTALAKEDIHEQLAVANRMEANFLLNVGPTHEGILRDIDVKVLSSLQD